MAWVETPLNPTGEARNLKHYADKASTFAPLGRGLGRGAKDLASLWHTSLLSSLRSTFQIHAVGGKLVVDATFGPPPLQDPFEFGADCKCLRADYPTGHAFTSPGLTVLR